MSVTSNILINWVIYQITICWLYVARRYCISRMAITSKVVFALWPDKMGRKFLAGVNYAIMSGCFYQQWKGVNTLLQKQKSILFKYQTASNRWSKLMFFVECKVVLLKWEWKKKLRILLLIINDDLSNLPFRFDLWKSGFGKDSN